MLYHSNKTLKQTNDMSRYIIQFMVIGFALFFSLKVSAQCSAKEFEKSNILRLSKNF